MDFLDGRLGRFARERLRRRGWALLGIAVLGWVILIGLGYGLWQLSQML